MKEHHLDTAEPTITYDVVVVVVECASASGPLPECTPVRSQFLTPIKDGAQVPELPLSPGRVFLPHLISMGLEIRVESSSITA